jgi:hypothetical protein
MNGSSVQRIAEQLPENLEADIAQLDGHAGEVHLQ